MGDGENFGYPPLLDWSCFPPSQTLDPITIRNADNEKSRIDAHTVLRVIVRVDSTICNVYTN